MVPAAIAIIAAIFFFVVGVTWLILPFILVAKLNRLIDLTANQNRILVIIGESLDRSQSAPPEGIRLPGSP